MTPAVPLTSFEGVKVGDVLQVATQLTDKQTGQPFWWKRFMCVVRLSPSRIYMAKALHLKMQVDPDKDMLVLGLGGDKQVVTLVPEDRLPQGVIAMKMKWMHKGLIPVAE